MEDNRNNLKEHSQSKIVSWLKRNVVSTILLLITAILVLIPDAKTFVLQQLLKTGLFNSSIIKKDAVDLSQVNVDFDFTDTKGEVRNTSSLRGKVIFINFWAPWCPPCRAEFPSIEMLYSKYKDNPGIFFLPINTDADLTKGEAYLEKEKFSFPMYHLKGSAPAEIFSGSLPTTVVLDKKGKIRLYHTGFGNYSSDKFISQIQELIDEK